MRLFDFQNTKIQEDPNKISGVVVGIVTDNQDPDGLGRVKLMLPRLTVDDESNWARVCAFMAGKERGAFFLPEVDDEVLVAFEHGDVNSPYVIGALWNGKDTAPAANDDGKNNLRVIKSRSGHTITLDDTEDAEKITIQSKSGHLVVIDDKSGGEKIVIQDNSEENVVTIDTANKLIKIEAAQDINISSPNGKLAISAKEIEMEASGNVKVKGAAIDIN